MIAITNTTTNEERTDGTLHGGKDGAIIAQNFRDAVWSRTLNLRVDSQSKYKFRDLCLFLPI